MHSPCRLRGVPWLLALCPVLALAAQTERMALVTANGRIGTMVVITQGRTVDVD